MKQILVTGGAGFIGHHFVELLLRERKESRVIVFDALTYAGSRENLAAFRENANFRLVKVDLADRDQLRSVLDFDPDFVVHLAAETHVDRSINSPEPFVRSNVVGTFELLEALRSRDWQAAPDRRFLHVSTDEVFGSLGPDDPPFKADSPYRPNSPYSASKAAADHLVRAYRKTYGFPAMISYCVNNYGPGQHPEKLIPLVIKAAQEGRPIPLYGDGTQVRSWIHVADHCRGLLLALERGEPGDRFLFGGEECTNAEMVHMICRAMDERVPEAAPHNRLIQQVPDRPGHDFRYALDDRETRRKLGWVVEKPLRVSIRELVSKNRAQS